MSKKNKTIVWLIIFIFLVVVFGAIATYAYFSARSFFEGRYDVDITSKGIDVLRFEGSEKIVVTATGDNFSRNLGHDLNADGTMDVILETTNNSANYCYELSVILPEDEVFVYSKPGYPELLLNVSKALDEENYEDIISNMDITTGTGTIKVPTVTNGSNYKHQITANKNETRNIKWRARFTLVWFNDTDQYINDNKSYLATFHANIIDC